MQFKFCLNEAVSMVYTGCAVENYSKTSRVTRLQGTAKRCTCHLPGIKGSHRVVGEISCIDTMGTCLDVPQSYNKDQPKLLHCQTTRIACRFTIVCFKSTHTSCFVPFLHMQIFCTFCPCLGWTA